MTENEEFFEAIALKGQCPDCHQEALANTGPRIVCKNCGSAFTNHSFYIKREPK